MTEKTFLITGIVILVGVILYLINKLTQKNKLKRKIQADITYHKIIGSEEYIDELKRKSVTHHHTNKFNDFR